MPMLSAFRQMAVGTLLGPEKERNVNWYLQVGHKEKLIGQLMPMLHKIAEIVLNCAISVRENAFVFIFLFTDHEFFMILTLS